MKKYTPLFILLFLAQCLTAQTLSDDNFIYSLTPKKAIQSSGLNALSKSEKAESVTYFDGLGRAVQTTAIAQGGDGSDIIIPVEYDGFGRQLKEYLPYSLSNTTTSYPRIGIASSLSSLSSLYNTSKYENTVNPFSEKQLESSPLNRVLKQGAPGSSWEIGKGHEIKLDYQANAAGEVRLYQAAAIWNPVFGLFDITFSDAGTYAAGELYKNVTYDENTAASPIESAGSTVEFKNKEGQVILKRTYDAGIKHDTYYVYDLYGNLTYVVPPKAEGEITAQILNDLCYQYKYDYRSRLVEKKLPGKQWEFIIYDKLNRVVATGPANSTFGNLTSSGWLITKYDAFDRPVITGWMPSASVSAADRTAIQKDRNAETANFSESKSATTLSINSVDIRYTNVVWPVNSSVTPISVYHILTVSYYDSYDYPGAPTVFGNVAGQSVYFTGAVKPIGLATGSWARVLESSVSPIRAEVSYMLYDNKSRVIRSYTSNFLGGYKQIDTNVDFQGKTIYTLTTHQRVANGTTTTIKNDYSYTDQDRLESVTQTIGGKQELLTYNTYDALGQLETKKVGNTKTSPLQVVDYTYNVRGWLKGVNNVNQLEKDTDPKDLFAFQINYNDITDPAKRLFNGNISQTIWSSDNTDKSIRNYVYTYDGLNRLKSAVDNAGLFSEDNIQYDKNGNIMKLQRKGAIVQNPSVSVAAHYGLMDDLTYSYDSANKLMRVADAAVTDQYGFKDDALNTAVDTADDYTYDANGNMLTDTNKGITSNITYNHLNLPVKIVLPTSNITYLYNAMAQKVQKTVIETSSANTIVTEYLNGFQYKKVNTGTTDLQFFPTQEGYVANNAGTLSYVFQYKDHLGNVRLSYAKNGGTGLLDIITESNYYAFGLEQKGYNNVPKFTLGSTIAEQYKYNGKELQDELGLNMYDYGARNYDPALGRWMNIDPLAEKYRRWSPYNYCIDNPVKFTDPDGMGVTSTGVISIGNGKYKVVSGKADGDNNVYIADANGSYTKKSKTIGQSVSDSSFLDDNGDAVKGALIDTKSNAGKNFITDEIIKDHPFIANYMRKATNGEIYDFKDRKIKERPTGTSELQYRYRGSIGLNGKIGSARDFGNMGAGIVSGRAELSWKAARLGFDALETYKKSSFTSTETEFGTLFQLDLNPSAEGKTTQNAEKVGWQIGIKLNREDNEIDYFKD